MKTKALTVIVREEALKAGFTACGFSPATRLPLESKALQKAISSGFVSGLGYLNRNALKRRNPALLLDGAETVISLIISHFPIVSETKSGYKIASYAHGNDYHTIISHKLEKLLRRIKEIIPGTEGLCFCDTGPVFEKALAVNSGLGWVGKNTLLISNTAGSFVFIGEIIINKKLVYDKPVKDMCGSCTECMKACPTKALVEPFTLDTNKCIAFHTIENKENSIPAGIRNNLSGWIYGCDICQLVCPYNRVNKSGLNRFFPPNDYVNWTNREWEGLDEEKFIKYFSETSIKRIGFGRLKRNIDTVTANHGEQPQN